MTTEFANEITDVAKAIYEYAELGSSEYKSSSYLVEAFKRHGFQVDFPYLGMKTAFKARYFNGKPMVGLLAEYDALPNGHSCGHDLIAAWAFGTAIRLKDEFGISVTVFGTPSEEGIGEYAGSKAKFAQSGAFSDVDYVIGMHPDDRWAVGSTSLADLTIEAQFIGKSSHLLSPDYGINALDPLVESYVALSNFRRSVPNSKYPVIGMIVKEGGRASNVIPDKASMEIDIRAKKKADLAGFVDQIERILKMEGEMHYCKLNINEVTPIYDEYKSNRVIDSLLEEECQKHAVNPFNVDRSGEEPMGSTDEANVSQVIPTGHLDVKIVDPGIPAHTDEFRIAADPSRSGKTLLKAIDITVETIKTIWQDKKFMNKIKEEFKK
ncbi:amidohydrolase [Thermoplasma volcanium]|nr:amidohydrolase [Thermoplasma volcanium]